MGLKPVERCWCQAAVRDAGIDGCSARVLDRVWRAERFSWLLTTLLHTFPDADAFTRRIHRAGFDALVASPKLQAVLAENDTGLVG